LPVVPLVEIETFDVGQQGIWIRVARPRREVTRIIEKNTFLIAAR